MSDANDGNDGGPGYQSTLRAKNQEIERLEDRVEQLESVVRELADRDDGDKRDETPTTAEIVAETAEVRAETATTSAGGDGESGSDGGSEDDTESAVESRSERVAPSDPDDAAEASAGTPTATGENGTTDARRPPNVTTGSRGRARTDGAAGSAYARVVDEEEPPEPTASPESPESPGPTAADRDEQPGMTPVSMDGENDASGAEEEGDESVDADEAAAAIGYERKEWPTPDDPDATDADEAAEPSISLSDVDPTDESEPLDAGPGLPEGGVEVEEKEPKDPVERMLAELREKGEQLRAAEERIDTDPEYPDASAEELLDLANDPAVVVRVNAARRDSLCNEDATWAVVARLAADAPLNVQEVADRVGVSNEAAHSLLTALRQRDLVARDGERRYALDAGTLRSLAGRDDRTARLGELQKQWRVD